MEEPVSTSPESSDGRRKRYSDLIDSFWEQMISNDKAQKLAAETLGVVKYSDCIVTQESIAEVTKILEELCGHPSGNTPDHE